MCYFIVLLFEYVNAVLCHQLFIFKSYKDLAKFVSIVINEINPNFKYPFALATNLFEMSNNHIYFAKHLPKLTEISIKNEDVHEVEDMLNYFTGKLLGDNL